MLPHRLSYWLLVWIVNWLHRHSELHFLEDIWCQLRLNPNSLDWKPLIMMPCPSFFETGKSLTLFSYLYCWKCTHHSQTQWVLFLEGLYANLIFTSFLIHRFLGKVSAVNMVLNHIDNIHNSILASTITSCILLLSFVFSGELFAHNLISRYQAPTVFLGVCLCETA